MKGWRESNINVWSHLCIPRYETVQPPYFQNRIIMFYLPIPTLIYLREIYTFPGSVCLFCCQICRLILGTYESLTDTWMWVSEWGNLLFDFLGHNVKVHIYKTLTMMHILIKASILVGFTPSAPLCLPLAWIMSGGRVQCSFYTYLIL